MFIFLVEQFIGNGEPHPIEAVTSTLEQAVAFCNPGVNIKDLVIPLDAKHAWQDESGGLYITKHRVGTSKRQDLCLGNFDKYGREWYFTSDGSLVLR